MAAARPPQDGGGWRRAAGGAGAGAGSGAEVPSGAARRPQQRLKSREEQPGPAPAAGEKEEVEEAAARTASPSSSRKATERRPSKRRRGKSRAMTVRGAAVPEGAVDVRPGGPGPSAALGAGGSAPGEGTEPRTGRSDGESGLCKEPREAPALLVPLDSSALLDEDSNQPMPVERFFGNVESMQDLPAAPLGSTTMSRREFRKLHFIAKEDEEEEAEDII